MATTKTRSASAANGRVSSRPAAKAKGAGKGVATAAREVGGPLITAGATAAGLAGGLALGSRMAAKPRGLTRLLAPQRTVLGLPIGRRNGLVETGRALGKVARELSAASEKVSSTGDDIREVRDQLDRLNRRSPVEALLDGLTHRRGAHKRES
jgi:hypothetical protein